jgi:aspartate/methionine/tyrosine aminotransferase
MKATILAFMNRSTHLRSINQYHILSSAIVRFPSPITKWQRFPSRRDYSGTTFFAVMKSTSGASSSGSSLSASRAGRAVTMLPTYLADARAVQRYSPSTPDGALQLSVAENQMLEDLIIPALTEFYSTQTFPADAIYYQPTHGREPLRKVVAAYLQGLLDLDGTIDPDGIVVGAGCNAVLENLCLSLAEPGQGVMIPLPYYAAFEFDLGSRADLKIIPVPTMDYQSLDGIENSSIPPHAYYPNRASLDAAKERSIRENSVEPRILLLSHPQNPLGISYPAHVIQEMVDWCRENKIHLISDEIYAGSIYRTATGTPFVSTLKVASSSESDMPDLGLGPYIHLVYALSKDFALSGLRVGILYSENPEIRVPLQKLNDLCCVSSQTQLLVQRMLSEVSDDGIPWSRKFLEENHRRLRTRGDAWQSCLHELRIPYLEASAGLFCWMDFREFLPQVGTDDERERELYLELLKVHGLLFTPGRSMKNERPGFFRCVFTAATDTEFALGMDRVRKYVHAKRG